MKQTEIIIVDNGSTDVTPRVCEEYKKVLGDCFRFIRLDSNQGFCIAQNIGLKAATGPYLIWLNDDTVVAPNWLEEMRDSMETEHLYHPKIGLVGPRSNCAAGEQTFTEAVIRGPEDIPVAMNYLKSYCGRFRAKDQFGKTYGFEDTTVFLSGFCMMVKREVVDTIGYIDEQYSPGGFCDNDFVLRAIKAGFGALISQRTFVYHYGSVTTNKYNPEMRGGVRNWPKYIKKFREVNDNKVVMIQRVKIDSDKQYDLFIRCAKVNERYVDRVIILSDKSTHPKFTLNNLKEIFGDKLSTFLTNKKELPFDEIRDRLTLMNAANASPEDWVLLMDHDECIDPNYPITRFKELLNPINPAVFGYRSLFNNYWRCDSMARVDGSWGKGFFTRLWKNHLFPITLRPHYGPDDTGLHCGNRPMSIPNNAFIMSDLVINHYGYIDSDEIIRKQQWYRDHDNTPPQVQKLTAGSADYTHLTNEVDIDMIVPKPFSLSINLMVKNEEVNIGRHLLTFGGIVREWVIVDTGSTDKTKEFLDSVGISYLEKPFNENFSEIRNFMIEKSTQDYIMHIDADEIMEQHGPEKIITMLNTGPDVCLQHLETQHNDGRTQIIKQPRLFKRDLSRFYYYGRVHETLDKSIEELPFFTHQDLHLKVFNPGFLTDKDTIKNKLEFYGRLLEKELEEHPDNAKAMFELALHYRNFGRIPEALVLLEKSMQIRPKFIRPRIEQTMIHLNRAYDTVKDCQGLPAEPDVRNVLQQLYSTLHPWKYEPIIPEKIGK